MKYIVIDLIGEAWTVCERFRVAGCLRTTVPVKTPLYLHIESVMTWEMKQSAERTVRGRAPRIWSVSDYSAHLPSQHGRVGGQVTYSSSAPDLPTDSIGSGYVCDFELSFWYLRTLNSDLRGEYPVWTPWCWKTMTGLAYWHKKSQSFLQKQMITVSPQRRTRCL